MTRRSPALPGPLLALAVAGLLSQGCSTGSPAAVPAPAPATVPATADAPAGGLRPTTAQRRPDESDGAFVFRTQCAGCHGSRGEGNLGPPLAGIATGMTVADEAAVVRAGRGRMPAFGSTLSEADIAAVVAYSRAALP